MNKRALNIACLLIAPVALIVGAGCQRNTEPTGAERAKISQLIVNYCMQGSAAYEQKHDLATAQKMFLLATQQAGGENLPPMAGALEGLAFTEQCQQKLGPAKMHFQQALLIYESPPQGPMNPALVRPLISLARIYIAQNRFGDAEPLLVRAAKICSANESAVGAKQSMRCMENLATVYMNENQLPKAEASLRQALDIGRHFPGSSNEQIKAIANALSGVLNREGKLKESGEITKNPNM